MLQVSGKIYRKVPKVWEFLNFLKPLFSQGVDMLTLCLPVTFAVNLGKQFGPRSGPTNRRAWSGSKLFDILMAYLKEFFQKVNFEKNQQTTKKYKKFTQYALS